MTWPVRRAKDYDDKLGNRNRTDQARISPRNFGARRIQTPNLDIRRVFDLVSDDVMTVTNRKQQPFSYGSLSGAEEFYFVQK